MNWVLAVATVPAAIAVVVYAYLQIMGTAGCSDQNCVHLNDIGFTLIQYGVPAVAVLAVAASFVTARRRAGILVPIAAWLVCVIAVIVLIVAFPH